MKDQKLAKQEVLELELDYDDIILEFDQYNEAVQNLEVDSDNHEFLITVEVTPYAYGDFENFSGEINVIDVQVCGKGEEDLVDMKLTSQIKEQLKHVR